MRQKCDICGEHKQCNDKDECFDCVQDKYDLEDWLPEDEEGEWSDDDDDDDEVE